MYVKEKTHLHFFHDQRDSLRIRSNSDMALYLFPTENSPVKSFLEVMVVRGRVKIGLG